LSVPFNPYHLVLYPIDQKTLKGSRTPIGEGCKMFECVTSLPLLFPGTLHNLSKRQHAAQGDVHLVERAQRGDQEAFDELVLSYQAAVYRQAFWLLNDKAAAEDAAQEAFYRAYVKIHTFCGSSFRAWILRIATNYCLDLLRKQKSHPVQALEPWDPDQADDDGSNPRLIADQPTPEQRVERLELNRAIRHALFKLSPEDRMPILLIDLQELSYLEAANALKVPEGTFKSRLSRARAKLIAHLEPCL
jgi:RNA polymerase sigma-70 factor (ECF subfamily)